MKLTEFNFPNDIKKMSKKELIELSKAIRKFLIHTVSKTGGHLASNLGVVELTMAMHIVFDSPNDKIVWDVGHQAYVHKILTGRGSEFTGLRQLNGISGFPKRKESIHDTFDSGHSSNSISVAYGMGKARDLKGEKNHIIAVIGDGAMTGGVAFEAMNNVGHDNSDLILILNDNEMSISKNTGGMSHHLSKLRSTNAYNNFKSKLKKGLKGIPILGEGIYSGLENIRDAIKYAIVPGAIFEELGIKYLGPIDGNDIEDLVAMLTIAKNTKGPVLLHVVTQKGKGYEYAEEKPSKYHGISGYDIVSGEVSSSDSICYSDVFGAKISQMAKKYEDIIVVSAAMVEATGLKSFKKNFQNRLFDVGIAEQHAVDFAAGMSLNGYKPFVAIYSTFLQRAYDQILIDVCAQNLPVIFCVDRGGIVGNDGETHHGIYDLSYFSSMPNITVMAPKDKIEFENMLEYAYTLNAPCAIRYPRGEAKDFSHLSSNYNIDGKGEILVEGKKICIIAIGKMVETALLVSEILKDKKINIGVVNARFAKPLDKELISEIAKKYKTIITLEDNTIINGFGTQVSKAVYDISNKNTVKCFGWPDEMIKHGNSAQLEEIYGLDALGIAEYIINNQ